MRPRKKAIIPISKLGDNVVRDHPQLAPDSGYRIFNAPRPLVGHETWQGAFYSGIFYAAIDDNQDDAEWMLKQNYDDDAVELEIVSDEAYRFAINILVRLQRDEDEKANNLYWLRLDDKTVRALMEHRIERLLENETWELKKGK